jgi:NADPH:quinone reductase-like Zn-dependent oxidoreductase
VEVVGMKAVVFNRYGSAEVLEYREMPKPTPSPNELLVKVKASSINPVDWKIRRGDLKLLSGFSFPHQLGCDFAGVVEAVGAQGESFTVGDEVYGFINPLQGGTYAEYIRVAATAVAPKSNQMSFFQAAAIPVAGLTAMQALCDLGQLRPGMKVLVNGASGGVGTFALQIAKALYAEVTGVCSTPNLELVQRLGADRVIDYTEQDFMAENREYDIIFDAVGKRSFVECQNNLSPEGTYITTLPTLENLVPLVGSLFLPGKKAKTILVQSRPRDLQAFNRLMELEKMEVIIDQVYPLSQAAEAHRYSETERAVGKIILSTESEE